MQRRKPPYARAALSAAAVGGALLTAAAPASATPSPLTGGDYTASTSVTLITGDRAIVETGPDGTVSAGLASPDEDFYTREIAGDTYVVPVEAAGLIENGTLDPELFNATGLVRAGYDDASRDTLPLITTGPAPRSSAVTPGARLESIGASAMDLDKEGAEDWWDGLATARSSSAKIWLDAPVEGYGELDPATGVPQTGAPEAWEEGHTGEGVTVAVLDTGVDAAHPDLADRVVGERDFTGTGDPSDGAGHGTHVASTVAGTGAASDGSRAGMAYDADLLNGRVLGPNGGQASWIISGMEWAAEQGADVINMSLGSNSPTDCSDPMAQAVNEISAAHDTLFVIAAGNAALRETVSSPGCADMALTVGAVDFDGGIADFSSRGPVLDTHAVKPDLSAPGVDIMGAAAGTEDYRAMSGTSMATPHVAGAAALIRDARPDWSAQQIKQALTSSVKDTDGSVYAYGSGEIRVPDAIDTPLQTTGSVYLGTFDWPHSGDETAVGEIVYTNPTDEDVSMKVSVTDFQGANGGDMPKQALRLSAKKITVPAGGNETVTVTATDRTKKVAADSYGEIGARVVATDREGRTATTSVGYWLEAHTVDLTLTALDRDGDDAAYGMAELFVMDTDYYAGYYFTGQSETLRVRAGTVSLNAFVQSPDGSYTFISHPALTLEEDTEIVLDAREGEEITVDTPKASKSGGSTLAYTRSDDRWLTRAAVYAGTENAPMYAVPVDEKIDQGEFAFHHFWRLYDDSTAVADSPFVYNVGFANEGRVETDQSYEVDGSDLAEVTERFHSQGEDAVYWDSMRAVPEGLDFFFAGAGMTPVNTPATRTAYYLADLDWRQLGIGSDDRLGSDIMFDPTRDYEAGKSYETDWNRTIVNTGVFADDHGAPQRVAERQGDVIGFAFPQFRDSEGRHGIGGFGDVGNIRVYADGEQFGSNAWPSGQFQVPEGTARVDATVTQLRMRDFPGQNLARATEATFSFDHAPTEDGAAEPLPVFLPDYRLPVGMDNRVPAGSGVEAVLGAQVQDGYTPEIVAAEAEVCYGEIDLTGGDGWDGCEWQSVPVENRDGEWTAVLDTTDHAGEFANFHVTLTDADGNSVEERTSHLFGIAAQ
ncbi:S8 family peptidase [Salininema proteolyticum]|uniref:S8 family serine peptidase n=1 Tax=Salininema proteolyticum TaxID=1607685 RepID=A0ABV8U2K5_9ACTN